MMDNLWIVDGKPVDNSWTKHEIPESQYFSIFYPQSYAQEKSSSFVGLSEFSPKFMSTYNIKQQPLYFYRKSF